MASGPSKQELEMYWQSSRQYFDELAEHYKQNDPEYYKEFILPFYSNPFRTGSGSASGKKSGCGARTIIAIALMLFIAGLGAAIFFLMYEQENSSTDKKKDSEYRRETETKQETIITDSISGIAPVEETDPETSIHYRRGLKLFEQKEYKLAERYLKRVPQNDPNYEDAQRLLKIIDALDKQDKRKKPIERFR